MSKHICLVPRAWDVHHSSTIELVLKKKISCDEVTKKKGAAEINVNGVNAKLNYWEDQPWMKSDKDHKAWPDPQEYYGVYMSCDYCRKPNKSKKTGTKR